MPPQQASVQRQSEAEAGQGGGGARTALRRGARDALSDAELHRLAHVPVDVGEQALLRPDLVLLPHDVLEQAVDLRRIVQLWRVIEELRGLR